MCMVSFLLATISPMCVCVCVCVALVYSGDQDFICNYLGGQAWTLNMDWSGKVGRHGWRMW